MLWCTTREGDVLSDPASGAYDTVLELNVNDMEQNRACWGWPFTRLEQHPKVYLAYTAYDFQNGNHERLSVFDWDGTGLVNEEVLHTVGAASIHNGSRLLVLPDNTLLMSTGDTGDGGVSSMDPNNDNGKILRFNLDGSIPTDNPSPYSHVYSIGQKTAKACVWAPMDWCTSANMDSTTSTSSTSSKPMSYGWPNVEGMCDGVCDWCDNWSEESIARATTSSSPCERGRLAPRSTI